MRHPLLPFGLILVALLPAAAAPDLDFLETFALPERRAEALQQLVPGSEDYYFYHALQAQLAGDAAGFEKILADYRKRHNRTEGVRVLENRRALLGYGQDARNTLDYLRRELNLHFNHEREALDEVSTAPSALDPAQVDGARMVQEALARDPNGIGLITHHGWQLLAGKNLTKNQRRALLDGLGHPDFPGLVDLAVADLQEPDGGGFGARRIHGRMTLAQLDQLAEKHPPSRQSEAWVAARLMRMLPDDDQDAAHDPVARRTYLEAAWTFVDSLDPKFNTLRAAILRELLVLDQAAGKMDPARFLAYARLPRPSPIVLREFREKAPGHTLARYGHHPFVPCRIPPLDNDEALVRDYLETLLLNQPDWKAYAPYFEEPFLKEVYATAHLLAGAGDVERMTSLLDPGRLKQLRERVEIRLLPTNPERWATDDAVKLRVAVKNVQDLLAKVYAVNAAGVCRETLENPEIGLDLDGLVATREFTVNSKEPPMRREEKTLELPDCKGAGVWMVELIGNGKSSRTLVRKGRLIALPEMTPSGHEFRVVDEALRPVADAVIRLGGQVYAAGKDGSILVPFSTAPGMVKAVIERGTLGEVFSFEHAAETIRFEAGFHLEREQLLPGAQATVLVRPSLRVNGMPVGLGDLEDLALTVATTNLKGVTSRDEVKIAKLSADGEFLHVFRVPDLARSIQLELRARIQPLNKREKQDLVSDRSFDLNGLRTQAQTEAVNFGAAAGAWFADVRGLNGETRAGRAVQFQFRHRWLRDPIHVTLSTDARGRIGLGPLADIVSVQATLPGGVTRSWVPAEDRVSLPNRLQSGPGGVLAVAIPDHSTLALFSKRGDAILAEETARLKAAGNLAVIEGLAPGDYELRIRPQDHSVAIRVTRGAEVAGHLVTGHSALKITDHVPLALGAPEAGDGEVRIPVRNASPLTRVHLVASRFLPAYDAFDALAWNAFPDPSLFPLGFLGNQYASGRAIGDEVRYVLDRRSAAKHAGVLLPRPGLILNPWERRSTSAEREVLHEGEMLAKQMADRAEMKAQGGEDRLARSGGQARQEAAASDYLDFLARESVVLANLKPDAQGVVRVKAADLRGLPMLTAIAVDARGGMVRSFSGPDSDLALRDLRLARSLPADKPLTEMKLVSPLAAGAELKLDTSEEADMQVFDRLAQVFDYFQSIRPDGELTAFQPVTRWNAMKEEDKLAFYGRHACHELAFFLYHKDRPFFDAHLRPYLANKRDKTFLDLWLLEADLSAYTDLWRFNRLNTVEQVLLARRLRDRAPMTARLIADRIELTPPDRGQWSLWFDTGLAQGSLVTDGKEDFLAAGLRFRADADKDGIVAMEEQHQFFAANGAALGGKAMAYSAMGRSAGMGGGAPAAPASPAPAEAKPMAEFGALALADPVAERDGARKAAKRGVVLEKAKGESMNRLEESSRQLGVLRERRKAVEDMPAQLYRKPEATKEWAEHNYHKRTPGESLSELVTANRFWLDYARAEEGRPFLSSNLAAAAGSLTETLLALAVLDLPWEGAKHEHTREGAIVTFKAGSPCVVFHKEIREAGADAGLQPVVMAQKFFDHQDRTRTVEGQTVDLYLREGFVKGRIYGGRVIVTNPTALPRRLDCLVQIPRGAIPVNNGFLTREHPLDVPAFGTQQIEYLFYFPEAGRYEAFPAMAAENDALAARAEAMDFTVLAQPAGLDPASWDFVSQRGDEAAVLDFLAKRNLLEVDLGRIAWRMKDKAFFGKTLQALRGRQVYHDTLWSYSVSHNDLAALREWLAHSAMAEGCGAWFASELLTFNPVERLTYEHLEYAPLVNPRAHPLGGKRTILNEVLRDQYTRLVTLLGHKPALGGEDRLALVYYLLLQDRLDAAVEQLALAKPEQVAEKLQLAYLSGWVALARGDAAAARAALQPHAAHPVPRWRKLFADALAQVEEIQGKAAKPAEDREGNEATASAEPSLELRAEGANLLINHRRLEAFTLNFYPMDIELLFSKSPFLREVGGRFAYIAPVRSQQVAVKPGGPAEMKLPLPAEFKGRNLLVEAVAGGLRKSTPVFAGDLRVEMIENYGQVRVTDAEARPLPRAYVKVYGRKADGEAVFYKDGYTDLRGRFDYASLNSDDLDDIERFALLILDDAHGAALREAAPPTR